MIRVLVPLDGSSFGEAILATVAKLAQPLEAEVELLTVCRPDVAPATRPNAAPTEVTPVAVVTGSRLSVPLPADVIPPAAESRAQALSRVEREKQRYLLRCAAEFPGVRTTVRVEFARDIGASIIERVRSGGFDLVAMATHGRTGFGHLLAGSICEQVIRSGVAPMIVLRP